MPIPFDKTKPISLRTLFPSAQFLGCADIETASIAADSRRCVAGDLFAALPGWKSHGESFISHALQNGASTILTERPIVNCSQPQCVVPSVRSAYAEVCHALRGYPAKSLSISAISGTNGKTTTAWLARAILQNAGIATGLIGTIEYSDGCDHVSESAHWTTPDAACLAQWMQKMVLAGTTRLIMEVSSHALDQNRTSGLEFDAAVMTNITHDHLDYHQTPEAYYNAKEKLFEHCKPSAKLFLNAEDEGCLRLKSQFSNQDSHQHFQTFSTKNQTEISGSIAEHQFSASLRSESLSGTDCLVRFSTNSPQTKHLQSEHLQSEHSQSEHLHLRTQLLGRHNLSNILAAIALVSHEGLSPSQVLEGIESVSVVPGRMERVESSGSITGFVDYAHTHDALMHAINTLKPLTAGRLILVFGAGGNRDRTKRVLMGRAAQQADIVIITNDNPRDEDPQEIANDILKGCTSLASNWTVELDREAAISQAVQLAEPGDVVLVAGKGHETTQTIGTQSRPFDDRIVLQSALRKRFSHSQQIAESIPA